MLQHAAVALTVLLYESRPGAAFVAVTRINGPASRNFPHAAAASAGERTARRDEGRDGDRGHGYRPEPNAGPISPGCRFDESQIDALLRKRRQCQRLKMYREADLILEGLNRGGVYVHDKRREWRADGRNHFGRTVRYVRRGGTAGLSDEDVTAASRLVEDRSAAKRRGEFHRSDELGAVLKTRYGVRVNDRNREWSVGAAGDGGGGAAGDGATGPSTCPPRSSRRAIRLTPWTATTRRG